MASAYRTQTKLHFSYGLRRILIGKHFTKHTHTHPAVLCIFCILTNPIDVLINLKMHAEGVETIKCSVCADSSLQFLFFFCFCRKVFLIIHLRWLLKACKQCSWFNLLIFWSEHMFIKDGLNLFSIDFKVKVCWSKQVSLSTTDQVTTRSCQQGFVGRLIG